MKQVKSKLLLFTFVFGLIGCSTHPSTSSPSSYNSPGSDSENRVYTVTWRNWDGSVLEIDSNVRSGATPQYNSQRPTRDSDYDYTYTFSGWSPNVVSVYENATYTASYTKNIRTWEAPSSFEVYSYKGIHIPTTTPLVDSKYTLSNISIDKSTTLRNIGWMTISAVVERNTFPSNGQKDDYFYLKIATYEDDVQLYVETISGRVSLNIGEKARFTKSFKTGATAATNHDKLSFVLMKYVE